MAKKMLTCPKCGRQVSSPANRCPRCDSLLWHKTVKETYGSWKGLGLLDVIPGIRNLPYPVRFTLMIIAVALLVIYIVLRIFEFSVELL